MRRVILSYVPALIKTLIPALLLLSVSAGVNARPNDANPNWRQREILNNQYRYEAERRERQYQEDRRRRDETRRRNNEANRALYRHR
jgi:hypothetical protein